MRTIAVFFALLCGLFAASAPARAVTISVDLTAQRMHVTTAAGESYVWPVSTARSGFATPHGFYKPYSLQRMHYSRKYHMSPMPYSIFFRGGYAIHGTYETAQLGRPASHGCVRLAPANAALLFAMVQREGARIAITGTPPGGPMYAKAHGGARVTVATARSRPPALAYTSSPPVRTLNQWMLNPGAPNY